ncbi:MAG: family 78 glycoside hydrolase catalytic domain [Victivallales bacterium]|nr:family 78 glycoside hydrolase catalytic domain [Victivallales bacterium]
MNSTVKLPNEVKGKWIWDSSGDGGDCQRLLFRSDFVLTEMPGEAELWVATYAFFQIVINGRVCTAGPIPHPGGKRSAYAVKVDVTHLLEVGSNRIVIYAHRENNNLSGVKSSFDALWMQIDVDGLPVKWTSDKDWAVKVADAYQDTGLRTGACDVFTEYVDLGLLGNEWKRKDTGRLLAQKGGWHTPDFVQDVSASFCILEPFDQSPRIPERLRCTNFLCQGTVGPACLVSWISFNDAMNGASVPGTYVAETYVWCEEAIEAEALLVCDAPYILYLNGEQLKSQAVPKLVYRGPSSSLRAGCLQPQDYEEPSLDMALAAGWNHIMMVVECISKRTGATLLFPQLADGRLSFCQKDNEQAEPGWNVSGPLNVPMALIYPSFPRDTLVKYPFVPDEKKLYDPSTYYAARAFVQSENAPEQFPISLQEGEYVVFDFGMVHYAFPTLKLSGDKGDIIDVVCGEQFRDGEVLECQPGKRRNASTIVLGQGANEWMSSTPKGVFYIMLIVRKASSTVLIENVELWKETLELSDAGSFSCSLPTLEDVWNNGVRTLGSTMQRIYMDSPSGDQAQTLPDAMIQSWASYYVFGQYGMAAHAIETFARCQFETGELNAASPSSLFQALPDYSLAWPVWLQRHYHHTGDKEFLMKMMPTLQRLMYYYNEIAVAADGPLWDLKDYLGVLPFIDYGNFERRGISMALNGLYCRALLSASWLSEMAGIDELAALYRERASSVAGKVNALLWNEEKGLYADSYLDGKATEECSWQSNVLAIYGGIANPDKSDEIWNQLFSDDAPMEKLVTPEYNNPYFKYYVLETACALGKSQWALRFIHYYWGSMAKAGAKTWWETFDPTVEDYIGLHPELKRCCGYGVSPNAFLISELLGIRPAEPGMKMVYFNPTPGDVSWARGTIPTPSGSITVSWRLEDDGIFNVNISATYILEVIPVLEPGIAEQAIFNVSDKVSIMAPEEEE